VVGWPWFTGDMFVPIESFGMRYCAGKKYAERRMPSIKQPGDSKGDYEFTFPNLYLSEGQKRKKEV